MGLLKNTEWPNHSPGKSQAGVGLEFEYSVGMLKWKNKYDLNIKMYKLCV